MMMMAMPEPVQSSPPGEMMMRLPLTLWAFQAMNELWLLEAAGLL